MMFIFGVSHSCFRIIHKHSANLNKGCILFLVLCSVCSIGPKIIHFPRRVLEVKKKQRNAKTAGRLQSP